jgi:predicted DNA-binding protein (MmcQ/YjbR family)
MGHRICLSQRWRIQRVYNNGYSIKKHWNTVNCQGNLPDEEIKKMIDLSYDLVVRSLPKRERDKL